MSKVTILQIGRDNWMNQLELPQNITWIYLRAGLASDIKARMKQGKIKSFDAVLVDDPLALWLLSDLRDYLAPYTVFYDETIKIVDPRVEQFTKEVCAVPADFSHPQELLRILPKALFSGQYGDKLFPFQIQVQPRFKGKVTYNGHENMCLEGDYGSSFKPLLNWS